MKGKYIQLKTINTIEILKSPETFIMNQDVFIRKDVLNEIVRRLEEKGYIRIIK